MKIFCGRHCQRNTGTWALGRKFFNSSNFLLRFEENKLESFAGLWFCLRNLPKHVGKFFLNFFNLVQIFPHFVTPIAATQTFRQNTSYLQLTGLNNWFYVVITIFAQHLNICSPKLEE